jgi:hypothetical protein
MMVGEISGRRRVEVTGDGEKCIKSKELRDLYSSPRSY